ncbi:MAG: glycosyltransferase family 4 protein [Actinomycetes bacterium]
MRAIYFVERFWPHIGGVEVLSAHLLPALAARGIELTVITSRDGDTLPEREIVNGIDVWRFRMIDALRDRDLDAIVDIRSRITTLRRELQPDLTHMVFTGATTYFALTTLEADPTPTILSIHGSWPWVPDDPHSVLQRAIRASSWITSCSVSALDDLCQVEPDVRERSSVILNGRDPASPPIPLVLEPPVVLCAARLTAEKGIDLAVDAIAVVRTRFPGVRLRLVGDGPVRAQIEPTLRARGLAETVEFVGWCSPADVATHIDAASIVLVPSRTEGFGLIALEAMLRARPVVATAVGGLPEVLGHDGGVLVEPESAAAIAEGIVTLLDRPELARSVALAGHRRALDEFPLARCVDAHEALYHQLVSAHA